MGRGATTKQPTGQGSMGRFHLREEMRDPRGPIRIRTRQGALDRFQGCLSSGVSDAVFNRVLPALSEKLGVELVAVWDDFDNEGFYGEAEVMIRDEAHELRELPDPIYGWLYSMSAPRPPEDILVPEADERTAAIRFTGRRCNGVDLAEWSHNALAGRFGEDFLEIYGGESQPEDVAVGD